VSLAVAGAKRVLEKEIDAKAHGELLDQLAAKL
jgi:F0F1-type ATP synthase membrane subunit b/b'